MSKPDVTEELASGNVSAPATGSEASARTSIPKQSLRLVLQLEDTPHNRATIMSVWGYIRAVAHPIEGSMSVLKREEITLIDCLGKTTMPLNDGTQRPGSRDVEIATGAAQPGSLK